jgi:uncharacterized membrane protein YgdD (TMEM256/DUF423 family)
MNWNLTGAILMGLGVALGAFGAHGLRGRLDDYSMGVYEKAVFYQFIHSLGLLIVSYLPKVGALPASAASTVCALLLAGVVIFSGSLYVLAKMAPPSFRISEGVFNQDCVLVSNSPISCNSRYCSSVNGSMPKAAAISITLPAGCNPSFSLAFWPSRS